MSTSDLKSWTQSSIAAIYASQSPQDVQSAFDAAMSPSVSITVNMETVQRDAMKEEVTNRNAGAMIDGASVKWENIMVVPDDQEKPDEVTM